MTEHSEATMAIKAVEVNDGGRRAGQERHGLTTVVPFSYIHAGLRVRGPLK